MQSGFDALLTNLLAGRNPERAMQLSLMYIEAALLAEGNVLDH